MNFLPSRLSAKQTTGSATQTPYLLQHRPHDSITMPPIRASVVAQFVLGMAAQSGNNDNRERGISDINWATAYIRAVTLHSQANVLIRAEPESNPEDGNCACCVL